MGASGNLIKQLRIYDTKQLSVDISEFKSGTFHFAVLIDKQRITGSFIKIRN